jgi:hypothetical protein
MSEGSTRSLHLDLRTTGGHVLYHFPPIDKLSVTEIPIVWTVPAGPWRETQPCIRTRRGGHSADGIIRKWSEYGEGQEVADDATVTCRLDLSGHWKLSHFV